MLSSQVMYMCDDWWSRYAVTLWTTTCNVKLCGVRAVSSIAHQSRVDVLRMRSRCGYARWEYYQTKSITFVYNAPTEQY